MYCKYVSIVAPLCGYVHIPTVYLPFRCVKSFNHDIITTSSLSYHDDTIDAVHFLSASTLRESFFRRYVS